MAINNLLANMHKWHRYDAEYTAKAMATYDHVIKSESLGELEMRYFNLAASCYSRETELAQTRKKRDAAYLAWKNAGGYK